MIFFAGTAGALKKFDALSPSIQKKLLLLDNHYLLAVRSLSRDELEKFSALTEEEIIVLGRVNAHHERLEKIRKRCVRSNRETI
jgi:hypothetical protein